MASRPRILIVDDEPAVLALMEEVFSAEGFAIETAASAAEALSKARRLERFDIALVDKNLPGRSGLELIRKLKEIQPDCEAIVITAYPSNDSAVEAFHLGVSDYVIKPFDDVFELVEKVKATLEARRTGAPPDTGAEPDGRQ